MMDNLRNDDLQVHHTYVEYDDTFYDDQFEFNKVIVNFLSGPAHIILDCSVMIAIVVCLRIIHLLIDILGVQISVLKHVTTIVLGLVQLRGYSEKVGVEGPSDALNSANSIVVYYTSLVILARFMNAEASSFKKRLIAKILMVFLIALPLLVTEYLIFCYRMERLTTLRSVIAGFIMRASSLVLTADHPIVDTMACVAYLCHPATCITGIWQPIRSDKKKRPYKNLSDRQLTHFMQQVFIASKLFFKTIAILIVYANISDLISLADSFFDHSFTRISLRMYLVALEFRTSHYFFGYMSTGLLSFWVEPSDKEKFRVCDLAKIEYPRSLLEVVKFWNLPTHQWLKYHVFWPTKKHLSNVYIPLGLTYVVSSMLHGMKFHIWAVLLTLGFSTWIEHRLRVLLSRRYNACLLTNKCEYNLQSTCMRGHSRTPSNSLLVNIINLCFTFFAMTHLAYLGCIFVGNTDQASYTDALAIWSELYFFAHLISAAFYLVVKLIPTPRQS